MAKKPHSTTDPKAIEEQLQNQEVKRERELNDLRAVLKTKQGRRVLRRILAQCRVLSSSFTGNSETYFNEGKRAVGIFIYQEIHEADIKALWDVLGKEEGWGNMDNN